MLEKIARETIRKHVLIEKNEHIVVGVSGGADSISLLYFLYSIKEEYNLKLTTVHINHCMRGEESDEDCIFVKKFCDKLGVELKVFNFDINKKAKEESLSTEEAGRKYRYKAFEQVLKENNAQKIAIAHNKDDNAETIIMRFFRGTGARGLSGIAYKRGTIIRPLLDCYRKDIEKFCKDNNLEYRQDSTNNLNIYTRNKIRLDLLPYIKEEFNPNIVENLTNMASIFSDEEKFLQDLAKKELDKIILFQDENKIILDIKKLDILDGVILKRVLRLSIRVFNENLNNISIEHIESIINIIKNQTGKKINLPNNIYVFKEYDKIIISKKSKCVENDIKYNYEIILDEKIYIKEINKNILLTKYDINTQIFSTKVCTISLNCDTIKDKLFLRQRNAGDRVYINGMTKKLKNIFIDLKIPASYRNLYPILVNENDIISVLGLFVCDKYKPNKHNNVFLHIWEEEKNVRRN